MANNVDVKRESQHVSGFSKPPAIVHGRLTKGELFLQIPDFLDGAAFKRDAEKRKRAVDQNARAVKMVLQNYISLMNVACSKYGYLRRDFFTHPVDVLPIAWI